MRSISKRRKSLSAFAIFVLLQMAWLAMPGMAAEKGTTPPTTDENSLISSILGMLESFSDESETEASPFEPPARSSTKPSVPSSNSNVPITREPSGLTRTSFSPRR